MSVESSNSNNFNHSMGHQVDDDSVSLMLRFNPAYQSHRKIAAIWEELARSLSLIQLKQMQVNSSKPNLGLSDLSEPDYDGSFDYPSMLEWVLQMARLIRERPVSTKSHPCPDFSQYGMSC